MASQRLITNRLGVDIANSIVSGNSTFYVFAGKHLTYDGAGTETPVDSIANSVIEVFDTMIFGKKVTSADIMPMVARNDWTTGTVYAMYDDQDSDLFDSEYFVSVQEVVDGPRYVYKCIDNADGANSTDAPLYASVVDHQPFITADGYIWKYLYQITNAQFTKFATTNYIPLIPDANVTANAIPGTIETIVISDGGLGYNNYYSGTLQNASDIETGGEFFYRLNSDASSIDDFYVGCAIKITSGAGAGQYRTITDYNGTTKVITIGENDDDPTTRGFATTPAVNDTYEITPYVYVYDLGGTKTANCFARALVSANTGNSIYAVEVLSPGAGYRLASANIVVANTVGVSLDAELRPIISPPGGHGSNLARELDARYVGISVKFQNNESATISTNNDFRSVGIIKDPLFNTIDLEYSTGLGNFVAGELVYQYLPVKLTGTVSIENANTALVGTDTDFSASLRSGDKVLVSDGVVNHFSAINTISNSTYFTLVEAPATTLAGVSIYKVEVKEYGYVSATATGVLSLTNVNPTGLLDSNTYIGASSFATLHANTIKQNSDTINVFDTFEQLTKFVGTFDGSARFDYDEEVIQNTLSSNDPSAYLHSISDDESTIYVSSIRNTFSSTYTITTPPGGSGAIFNYTTKYDGDLVKDSGQVLYIENLESSINRSDNSSETVKIILEF